MYTLADHADYRITYHPAPQASHRMVITFGGQPSDLSDKGFGSDFAMSQGWNHIFVAQRVGTQYQGLSSRVFRAAVSPLCAGMDTVCYGSSLGAYAALYYGGQIDARIIAAAPMLPAWKVLKNRAYADVVVAHSPLQQMRRSRHAPVVIYDPALPRDVQMLNGMVRPTYPDIRELALPFAGHTVLITLSRARQIKPLILGIVEHDRIPPITLPTRGSAIWHRERARALKRIYPDQACKEMELSFALEPSTHTMAALLSMLLRRDDLVAAQQVMDAAAAADNPRVSLIPAILRDVTARGLVVPDALCPRPAAAPKPRPAGVNAPALLQGPLAA